MNYLSSIYSSPSTDAALPDAQVSPPVEKHIADRVPSIQAPAEAKTATIDPELLRLRVCENSRLKQVKGWKTSNITLATFEQRLLSHHEIPKKYDAEAFVPGALQGDQRNKSAVSELSAIILDLDKGEDLNAIRQTIQSKGLLAFIHSTHSHLNPETEIKLDDYRNFTDGAEVTVDGLRRYLREKRKFRSWIVKDVEIADPYRETPNGVVCVARHAPLPKYRVALPLRNSFRRIDYIKKGMRQAEFEALWKAKYEAVAASMNVEWDESCSDVARAFFYPSCKPGAPRFAEKIEGRLLNLDEVEIDGSPQATTGEGPMVRNGMAKSADDHNFIYRGFDLRTWIAQRGSTFEIEKALKGRAPADIFRSRRTEGGLHIACPFEETHTEAGGDGTFVVASENEGRGFGIHCCHDHCLTERGDGKKVDRLIFIRKMLEDGWLTLDHLQNPALGGGAISARVYHESLRRLGRPGLRAVDRDGNGIDAGIFHFNFIAKPDVFDFDRLNSLCQTQIAKDVSPEQIAEFIESGRVTVANLIECSQSNEAAETADPYFASLLHIARKKAAGKLLSHGVNVELASIRTKLNVKQKAVEQDFRQAEQQVQSPSHRAGLGLLSAEDAAIVKPLRDYVRDFAFLNTGGKGVVMNLSQPDLSKAIMGRDAFDLLYRNDWFEVIGEDGKSRTIFPAKQFLAKPPKTAQFYRGGLVFKPSGTVAADEYNLYRGMLVSPDESGSCSMLWELICDVWAQGNEQTTLWVMEWLMHIVAHPGDRVGTSIAIRGGYGDGKSIVFEKLMGSILGDMMLRVANHKMILGDFNEAIIGKLVTVLEEAAFAGDKAAFDKMKELITGEKVLINPKFKAPITVDNFSRLVVISNNDHFLHIKPGDRRYTVLESSPAWKGTNKFEQLLDQWVNGGAARFVYDALNHSFQRFDDQKKLAIATNLKTTAAVRQMAHSRSSLEKCVVEIILRGDFTTQRGSDVHVFESGGFRTLKSWELDKPFDISSLDLERFVKSWLADFDSSAGKHEATLHTIIETLGRYIGETDIFRPKGPTDAATGKRPQQPTRRLLPTRRKALEHAWRVGLITNEEYESALPVATAEAAQDFKFSTEASSAVEASSGLAAANDQFFEFRTRSSIR